MAPRFMAPERAAFHFHLPSYCHFLSHRQQASQEEDFVEEVLAIYHGGGRSV